MGFFSGLAQGAGIKRKKYQGVSTFLKKSSTAKGKIVGGFLKDVVTKQQKVQSSNSGQLKTVNYNKKEPPRKYGMMGM